MPTVPAQQPGGAPKGLWWDQMRAASELGGITKQSKCSRPLT
jgi:hypothetical protein